MKPPPNGFVSNRVLKLNVGFLLSHGLGLSREVAFDVPDLAVSDDLHLAYLKGTLRVSHTSEGILIQGELNTAIKGECRRCLTPMNIPLTVRLQELFAIHPNPTAEFVVGEDAIIDLTPLVREEIIIATPIAPVCSPDCAGLCPRCGHNLNEGPCECELDDIDPRFAILQQLRKQE